MLKIKKEKLQDVSFVTQKSIGQKYSLRNQIRVLLMQPNLYPKFKMKVCDEEVNIILITTDQEILTSEMETNAIIDTTCTKTVPGEK